MDELMDEPLPPVLPPVNTHTHTHTHTHKCVLIGREKYSQPTVPQLEHMAKDINNPICVGGRENCWYWLIGQQKAQYVQDITFTVDKDQHKILGFSMKKMKLSIPNSRIR